ncbi:hypothetical protein EZS27_006122 [termite gut metagenome]|uniref:Uncharacterized protein n=2 Tax=termite gut metagenome TaxID=433724 RepID=A0A5J4SK09_9ZZZZ
MKKLLIALFSVLIVAFPYSREKEEIPANVGCDINFHAVYILGLHIGALEIAAHKDMGISFTDDILGFAIEAADGTNCVSSTPLKEIRAEMANAFSSFQFEGRLRALRDQYSSDIENNCICLECNTVSQTDNTNWYWPVENHHVWFGKNIHQINELGFKQDIYQGSAVWGWIYYLKDTQGRWLRIDGNKVYYVNWDTFKTLYSYVNREEFPTDPNNSHKDIWRKNSDGTGFELTYVEKNTEWETPVPTNHPWYGKTGEQLNNLGYKTILYHGSAVWGWNYYFKDNQGYWYRVTGNQVFSVNWDNFKTQYSYVRRDQLNSNTVSYQDIWKQNKTGHELTLIYLK